MAIQPPHVTLVHAGDIPGLTSTASGDAKTAASADNNEFITVVAVLPDAGDAATLLQAFTMDSYLSNVTGHAEDAAGQPLTLSGAPAGARAFSYTGTPVAPNGTTHPVEGEVIAFVQSSAFVVINHGRYAPSTRQIDVGQIAANIAQRLASPGLN